MANNSGNNWSNNNYPDLVQECPFQEAERPPVSVRASLYFDGTNNNRTNTDSRIAGTVSKHASDDSYVNDLSNVAILERMFEVHPGVDVSISVYVEGIGTTDNEGDSFRGGALGTGDTGIKEKVVSGIEKLLAKIIREVPDRKISYIYLDCFGFSRGAAAARYYIYQMMKDENNNLRKLLINKNFTVGSISFKFAGLFDTVASWGVVNALFKAKPRNTRDLELDAITHAERTYQLCAADEYRNNFPLTNIKSALGKGSNYFLPGAHSDVGGGYNNDDAATETDLQVYYIDDPIETDMSVYHIDVAKAALEYQRNWLLDCGWYLKSETEIKKSNARGSVVVNRTGIRNHYAKIPLNLMAEAAMAAGLVFKDELKSDHAPTQALTAVDSFIRQRMASGLCTKPEDWTSDRSSALLTQLRHDYLHLSSFYGKYIYAPRWSVDTKNHEVRKRLIYEG